MTSRTVMKETSKVNEDRYYLIVFDDNTYSVADRKQVLCPDIDLMIGTKVKVKSGTRTHIGNLTNIGPKRDLDRVAALQFGKQLPANEKTIKRLNKKPEVREDAPKPKRKLIEVETENEESDSDDEEIDEAEKERERLYSLVSNLEDAPIANIPKPGCECKVHIAKLMKEMSSLNQRMTDLEKALKTKLTKNEGTPDRSRSSALPPSPSTPMGSLKDLSDASALQNIEHNGINLLTLKAPAREPHKNALRLMDKLFSVEEMSQGILFASKRSSKKELDQERIGKMLEVLYANYGKEKIQKMHQHVVDVCNQKCRDCARKLQMNQKVVESNDE